MPSYEASLVVAAPHVAVWRVLSAVVAWPDWLPTVSSVEPLDGTPLRIGFRYAVRQPRLRPATWVVTELEPPHSFVWQAHSPGLLMTARHKIAKSSPGESRVTLQFCFDGLLGAPMGWLFRSTTERYLAQELASLKSEVEGQQ